MALAGLILILVIFFFIGIAIFWQVTQSNPTEPSIFKPKIMIDLSDGRKTQIEEEYMNPDRYIKHDVNTGKNYIMTKSSMFKKSNRIDLEHFKQFVFEGYTIILNHIDVINRQIMEESITLKMENTDLRNELAEKMGRITELETKYEEMFSQRIDQMGKIYREVLPKFIKPGQSKRM